MNLRKFDSTQLALGELQRLMECAKITDPFAAVTVIVPSRGSGLDVPRYLARNAKHGAVGVRAYTLLDLALEVFTSSPLATGRSLIDPMLRQGSVSTALADAPGVFSNVADQPATSVALTRSSVSLDGVDVCDTSGMPEMVQDVVRIHRSATARLSGAHFTQSEAYAGAAQLLADPSNRERFGTIIGFSLPPELGPDARPLLDVLVEAGMDKITAVGSVSAVESIVSSSDSDDECRAIVRRVATELASGTAGHRIGVFYSASDPYRDLLAQRLSDAGIEFSGPSAQRLRDLPVARGLVRLLRLNPDELDVRAVLNTMAEGTLHWPGHGLPSATACERLYVSPPADEEADDTELDADDAKLAGRNAHRVRIRAQQEQFAAFQGALSASLGRIQRASNWASASSALRAHVQEFMGPRSSQEHPRISSGRTGLLEVVDSLEILDGIAPAPSASGAGIALEQGIDRRSGRTGKIGVGVCLGTIADGVGRDLDVVILAGLAEGLAPAKVREDPLLPDAIKISHGTGLATAEVRARWAKEQFQTVLATAPRTLIFYPRGNLRGGGSYEPSRWVSGANSEPSSHVELKSYEHGIRTGAGSAEHFAVTEQEWRLRTCLSGDRQVLALTDAALSRSLDVRKDRHLGVFSRFNGNLAAHASEIFDQDKAISPTSLEDWVTNPFGYFLKRVLRVAVFEDVQLELQIPPIKRGDMMHRALEEYVLGITHGRKADSEDDLLAIGEATFQIPAGASWLRHIWARDRSLMLRDLRKVMACDQLAATEGWTYQQPEAGFGPPEFGEQYQHPPVELGLADGTVIKFLGFVDRIDRHASGAVRVIDYKTGSSEWFSKLSQADPTGGGTKFQLPVYGLFARQFQPEADVAVHARYWFISNGTETIGYEVSDAVVDQLRAEVSAIVSALRRGIFPHKPEESRFANFTKLAGAAGAELTWRRLTHTPELAELTLLKAEK